MGNNFQDNVTYGDSTLGFNGDQIFIGGMAEAGAKSLVFNSSDSNGHLAWLPNNDYTINLPNANGTLLVNSQAILSISAGTTQVTSGQLVFSNSNGVSFGANGQTITASVVAGGGNANVIAAGTQTAGANSTVIFSNSNGISFGMTNSSIITASYTVPTQTNQTEGWYGIGNTTNNSSTTVDARSMSFQGTGGLSVGFSNGSIQLSAPVISSLSATGNASISSNGSTISLGANAVAAAVAGSTVSSGTLVFSNSNNIQFGLNGSTITASANANSAFTASYFYPFAECVPIAMQHGQGSLHIHPIPDKENFQFDRMIFDVNWSQTATSTGTISISMYAGFYSRNVSTLSLVISSSGSQSVAWNSGSAANFNGAKNLTMGWTTTMSKNDLWLGIVSSSTFSSAAVSISQYCVSDINSGFLGLFGISSAATNQDALGLGYYTAVTAGIPASIAFSQINGTNSNAMRPPLYRFLSQTA